MPSCSCSICGISKVAAIGTAFLLMSSQPAAAHRASRSESGKGVRSLRSLLAADDHAGHDHHDDHAAAPECACLAASEGWPLDCTDKTAMAKALTYLEANADCKTKAHSATCEKNYNVIRAHHDHCDHDEVPEEVETEIHEFESFYTKCKIHRKYDVTIDDCAEAHCDEASELNATVTKLAENNCATGTNCQTKDRLQKRVPKDPDGARYLRPRRSSHIRREGYPRLRRCVRAEPVQHRFKRKNRAHDDVLNVRRRYYAHIVPARRDRRRDDPRRGVKDCGVIYATIRVTVFVLLFAFPFSNELMKASSTRDAI